MRNINTRPLTSIVNKQKIEPADLKRLRREVFPRGLFSVDAADTLAHLHEICDSVATDWSEYYLTAMVKFILHENKPKGAVTPEQSRYLYHRLSDNGVIETPVNYELLLRILDQAVECPDELVLFALDQIRLSLLGESDLLRKDVSPLDRSLQKSDIDLIKRILNPASSSARRQPTRAQIEFLMDLNDLTEQSNNHRSWADYYTKTISGFLLDGSKAGSRDSQHRASWRQRRKLAGGLRLLRDPKASAPEPADDQDEPSNPDQTGQTEANDPIAWFLRRMKEKKAFNANDTALLAKLKGQASKLHTELAAYVMEGDAAAQNKAAK